MQGFNSFLASNNFCCLLITFTNSLDPDQETNLLLLIVFLKEFLEEKSADTNKSMKNSSACKEFLKLESFFSMKSLVPSAKAPPMFCSR